MFTHNALSFFKIKLGLEPDQNAVAGSVSANLNELKRCSKDEWTRIECNQFSHAALSFSLRFIKR